MISPNKATRLSIFKSLLIVVALAYASVLHVFSNSPSPALREKEIRKGENVINQLRRLEQLTTGAIDLRSYGKLVNKIYPDLFAEVADLKESDLKADLTTAVFLYEQAFQELSVRGKREFNCEDAGRSIYARICVENRSDSVSKFLLAKARLHTAWADSTIRFHRGARDLATLSMLEETRRERSNDLKFAEKAVAALKTLEDEVCPYSSLAEFEEKAELAHVSFERLAKDAAGALLTVDEILPQLPRGTLFYSLYNARNSYADGLFWWQKTYRRRQRVVDASALRERDELKSLKLDPLVTDYTVTINWRRAAEQIRRAENFIQAARTK